MNYGSYNSEKDTGKVNPLTLKVEDEQEFSRLEKAFETIAPNAPEEVKKAWEDAAAKAGVNGMGLASDGKMTNISAIFAKRFNNSFGSNTVSNPADYLGNSIEAAIRAAEEALQYLNDPKHQSTNYEIKHFENKEKYFYETFINNLQQYL